MKPFGIQARELCNGKFLVMALALSAFTGEPLRTTAYASPRVALLVAEVPYVSKMPLKEAAALLDQRHLRFEVVARIADDDTPGTVIHQDPQVGTHVPPNSSVRLTLSAGSPSPQGRTPNLYGMTTVEAVARLRSMELRLQISGTQSSSQPTNSVVAQDPPFGSVLPGSRTVGVTLAAAPSKRTLQIPGVIGMSLLTASQTLSSARFTTGQVTRRYNYRPAGIVADQYPEPGQEADAGTAIGLVLSEGPAPEVVQSAVVPNLHGDNIAVARQMLSRYSLVLGNVSSVLDPSPRGVIVAQLPLPEAHVPAGSAVQVSVSTGGTVVPKVVDMSQESARSVLTDRGFRIGSVRSEPSPEPSGSVTEQEPLPGTIAETGSDVSLVISTGPVPGHSSAIPVPDLTGLTEQDARRTLEAAGLKVGSVDRHPAAQQEGTVISQSPAAGISVQPGKRIQFSLSWPGPGTTVSVPDLSGMTLVKARDILAGIGLASAVTGAESGAQGLVRSQSPAPYEVVALHTVIELTQASSFPPASLLWSAGGLSLLLAGFVAGKYIPHPAKFQFEPNQNEQGAFVTLKGSQTVDLALQFAVQRDSGLQTLTMGGE